MGQVWYLIVSIPDPCCLSYFVSLLFRMTSTEAPLVTPRIILQTHLEDIESGMQKTTAIVGEPILWEMDGPGTPLSLSLSLSRECTRS